MKDQIISNLDKPRELEKLYRENKTMFTRTFDLLYPDIKNETAAQIWNERLHYEQKDISWGTPTELAVVVLLSLVAGLLAKIPDFAQLEFDLYYQRNIAFVVFPALMAYFVWKQTLSLKKLLITGGIILLSVFYINLLPADTSSDTLFLACLHLPLFMWTLLGFTFTGNQFRDYRSRIDFLRYNGDLVVLGTVIMIAGAILSVVTIGLFELIGMQISEFYFRHIAIWGIAAVPVVGTYLVRSNQQLVKNVSPVIARVFTPLVLVMLVVYLVAMVYSGKDPYNDREFLLIFNLLLIGVMALILFSVAETSKTGNKTGILLLFMLSVVTIIVNGIALSAIVFRITEWGITPNRLAVLGSNVLILINLMMVTYSLFRSLKESQELESVENRIAWFLPVYSAWTVIVIFVFPVAFGFN
jgi:hypothetical protein